MVLSRAGLWSFQHFRFAQCLGASGLHLDYGRQFGEAANFAVIKKQALEPRLQGPFSARKNDMTLPCSCRRHPHSNRATSWQANTSEMHVSAIQV
jgi:hypothetical protein